MSAEAWSFAEIERARIDRHWRQVAADKPSLWNGRVLMCAEVRQEGPCLWARFVETDFASMVAWRDWGWPDRTVCNCFGSAVIRSRDGALIYGRMGANTLNSGFVYPPGGSLEPRDVLTDGRVDVLASIARELREETGLDAASAEAPQLFAVFDGARLSVAQVLGFEASALELAEAIERHRATETSPELDGTVILRSVSQIDATMPGYAARIARLLLTADPAN